VWVAGFWSREEFTGLAQVQAEAPTFARWYHTVYQPPALQGKTPAQLRQGIQIRRLTTDLRHLIPIEQLPITAGRIHFMRKVDTTGHVEFLNETWLVGSKWIGEYVRATVDTAQQTLTVWHQADAEADWRLIKTRQFRLKETVHAVLPQFKRNRTRCRDYWPG
jgi:hypothetical protein